ncbi:hypothetical protein ACFSKN_10040 [Mariniflexile gromovii]|nr:hypothetical protein [Mariniflexile gromovii]
MSEKTTQKNNSNLKDFKEKFKLFMEALREQAIAASYSIHR